VNNYRLIIQYDGGRYRGWQRLGREEDTIQGKIESVLSRMLDQPIEIIGCSRTDAGVHALAQVANFRVEKTLDTPTIQGYLNRYLPQDICVSEVSQAPENWHARFHARTKTYLYKIWNEAYPNPFMRKYSLHVPEELDLAKMRLAATSFLGEHDFTAFSNAKSKQKSRLREIYSLHIEREGGFVLIRIRGNGFLYNMARKMIGALLAVGRGEMVPRDIAAILCSRERGQIGPMAEACGLYLEKIEY
jgi:tRNA pseudouridine38-40 synthase